MRHALHQSVCVVSWRVTRWIQSFPLAPIQRSAWASTLAMCIKRDRYAPHPAAQQALTSRCLPLPTLVIGLLASFTQLLLKGGSQHDSCFVGDFLRVGFPLRLARSHKGLRGMPTLCSVSYGQMARVEPRETVRKGV
jgi:hypothetical protein